MADLGFNLWPSLGNIYLISPDLQRVETVVVGDLMGERDLPVRLLVLDLATKEIVKVLDPGMSTHWPPVYFYPDC